jgi:hypothetical protein
MIDPIGMTVTQWADAVILSVGDAWALGRLDDEARWQDWGVAFLKASPFNEQAVPSPYGFDDWYEWAMYLYPFLEVN